MCTLPLFGLKELRCEEAGMGNYLEYESWIFTQDDIKDGNLYRSRDLLSASLEIDTLNVTVECTDPSIVNFKRNAKLVRYFAGKQDGIFYVQSVVRIAPKLYKISATSKIGLLQTGKHMGGIYTGQTAEELIEEICGSVPVMVKSNIKDIQLYGWLPIAAPRDNLAQVLFAIGATAKEDMLGTLRVEGLWDGLSSTVPADRMYNDATVEYNSAVSSASVTEHQYSEGGELATLFEGTAAQGDVVTFSGPYYDLQATGFTVLESGANYAKISSGSGVLQGRPYIHNTRQITRVVNEQASENIKSVENATLVSLINSGAIADRMVNYYKYTQVISAPAIYNGEKPGDRLSIYHPYEAIFSNACLQSEDITLSGTLKSQEKSLVGYIPIDTNENLVNRVEILTGSGTWTPPDGVEEFRAVLIQGGSSGESGEDGSSAKALSALSGSTQLNTTTLYSYPFGSQYRSITAGSGGGSGGSGGTGGLGGKINEVSFNNASGKNYDFSCGRGSHDSESEGEETVFGEVSSANGARMDNGFLEIFSGTVYGKKGNPGIKGGAGGSPAQEGESVGGAKGGAPNLTTVKVQSNISGTLYSALEVGKYAGSGGGGAGGGTEDNPGGDGMSQSGTPTCAFSGAAPSISANGISISGGTGGFGANGANGATYGSGGDGGSGGGGGGATGDAFIAFGTTNGSTTFGVATTAKATIYATAGAAGGSGGTGGNGADGCILVYYSVKEPIGKIKQLQDRTGKIILDRYGRRIIM